jgi:hypothetical protein
MAPAPAEMMLYERLCCRKVEACCELGMLVLILMPLAYDVEQNHDCRLSSKPSLSIISVVIYPLQKLTGVTLLNINNNGVRTSGHDQGNDIPCSQV